MGLAVKPLTFHHLPYSSVPDPVRAVKRRYSLAFSGVRQYYDIENRFFEERSARR